MDVEDDESGSFSQISVGPGSMAPKVLVGIVRVEKEEGKTLYVMQLYMVNTAYQWTIKRRYSEFLQVRDDLEFFFLRSRVNQCFGCRWFWQSLQEFEFPRKHLLTSHDPSTIQHRKYALDRFSRLMCAHTFSAIPKCVACSKTPFCRVRDFFTRNAVMADSGALRWLLKLLVPETFAPISDPSKSKIEFRRGRGILRVLQLEKPVHLTWQEYDNSLRQTRLQRRSSSVPLLEKAESIAGGDEEEKPLSVPQPEQDDDNDDDELDMTGVHLEVVTTANAIRLRPLRKQDGAQSPPPCAEPRSLWEPWELDTPKPTAAKEA
ncbi:hypothetical protein P43SY_001630 [Pythium insidiosum]|uniref:PX domain-containing protein n=1 Tax=Pythium insidiosum TaxID=114742 RepID=A0AAD5QCM1_PYTIN|nr:hypothetical protein P43SY_001630 [Pythium insidiosum]